MRVVARPLSPFTFEFGVERDGTRVARFRHRALRPGGRIWVGDVEYTVARAGFGSWAAEQAGVPGAVVQIRRLGGMQRTYETTWDGGSVQMIRGWFGLGTTLLRAGEEVGRVRLRSLFTRTLVADIPDDVPPPAAALILWLIVRQRRRAAAAASS